MADHLDSITHYGVEVRRRSRDALLIALALSLAAALLLLRFPPGWVSLALCLGVAFIAMTWQRPALGVASVLGITLLFEQYDFASFRPITRLVPLFDNLSSTTGVKGLDMNPLEILLLALTIVVFVQAVARRTPVRKNPLWVPVSAFAVALCASLLLGLAQGGAWKDALWEVRGLAYFSLLVLVVPQTLATRRDVRMIMWVAIVAIGAKAAQGVYNWAVVLKFHRGLVRSVTGHEDAVFFAWMFVLLIGLLVYHTARRQRRALLAAAPLTALAFYLTDRRAAYVALALGLIVLVALIATDASKRRLLVRVAVPALIMAALVVGLGWNNTGRLGRPAAVFRSIVAPNNAEDQASDYYRRAENVNLMQAIDSSPLVGLGFGRPFQTPGQSGIVNIHFSLENYIAHDQILWVWAKMGTLGFALFWVMVGGVIVFGGIVFRTARLPYSKVLAALVTCAVVMQIMVSYVDLQLTYARNMVFLGVLVGILARLPALDEEEPIDGCE